MNKNVKDKVIGMIKKVILVIVVLVAVVLVQDSFKSQKSKLPNEDDIFKELMEVANKANSVLPAMVDKETRLDTSVALQGRVVLYKYTLINYLAEDIDTLMFVKELKPKLVNVVKTSPQMAALRELNVTLIYNYRDKESKHICSISIKPEDYKIK